MIDESESDERINEIASSLSDAFGDALQNAVNNWDCEEEEGTGHTCYRVRISDEKYPAFKICLNAIKITWFAFWWKVFVKLCEERDEVYSGYSECVDSTDVIVTVYVKEKV
jgi:hypothetical protein